MSFYVYNLFAKYLLESSFIFSVSEDSVTKIKMEPMLLISFD